MKIKSATFIKSSEDFPTLLRPINAYSGIIVAGH